MKDRKIILSVRSMTSTALSIQCELPQFNQSSKGETIEKKITSSWKQWHEEITGSRSHSEQWNRILTRHQIPEPLFVTAHDPTSQYQGVLHSQLCQSLGIPFPGYVSRVCASAYTHIHTHGAFITPGQSPAFPERLLSPLQSWHACKHRLSRREQVYGQGKSP